MTTIVTWKGSMAKQLARKNALDGLEELARAVILPDADEHCPVDRGTMRSTHQVQRDEKAGAIHIGYGGPAAPYTTRQHENLTYHHTVGEAKWLENAFNRHCNKASVYIKKRL